MNQPTAPSWDVWLSVRGRSDEAGREKSRCEVQPGDQNRPPIQNGGPDGREVSPCPRQPIPRYLRPPPSPPRLRRCLRARLPARRWKLGAVYPLASAGGCLVQFGGQGLRCGINSSKGHTRSYVCAVPWLTARSRFSVWTAQLLSKLFYKVISTLRNMHCWG
jgi:hypothetical protein